MKIIKFCLTNKDYSVLIKALEYYPKDKKVTNSLKNIARYQYEGKIDKEQKKG